MGLLEAGSEPVVWIEVPGYRGFDIKVKYLNPATVRTLTEKATTKKLNRQTRQMEDSLDAGLLAKLMTGAMIVDWRGLTLDVLDEMIPLSAKSREAIKKAGELKFSDEDLEVLADHTYSRSFMDTVMEIATDLSAIRDCEEKLAEKN